MMHTPQIPLLTPWGETLDRDHILPEYPRPQLQRESYINLNGVWQYAITKSQQTPPRFDGEILVPFSPECPLSGVNRQLMPDEFLFYHRTFTLPDGFHKGVVYLHFGAVDQEAEVILNGKAVCRHTGGYLPFSADITQYLTKGENRLTVRVRDVSDTSYYARGKQKLKRGGIFYTAQSGIWQTVWLESVPTAHIRSLRITPDFDSACVHIQAQTQGEAQMHVAVLADDTAIAHAGGTDVTLQLGDFHPWSPEDPYLYDLKITYGEDEISSYFAMRKISLGKNADGYPCMLLNNKPYFHNGLLDQGYYPDGFLTPPSDAAMCFDIQTAKDLGYNMLRKHIKIEPLRWYYHCDRLGMLVWQDMVNGGEQETFYWTGIAGFFHWKTPDTTDRAYRHAGRVSAEGREMQFKELRETVDLLYNVPSIVLWVPFNEGWGQFHAKEAYELVKALDSTRLIDHASGWHDQGAGDFNSRHIYFTAIKTKLDSRPFILSEFGGLGIKIPDHMFSPKTFGYKMFPTKEALTQAYAKLFNGSILPYLHKGMAACVYTQLTDVEDEVNGILTYDRKALKLDESTIKQINQTCKF